MNDTEHLRATMLAAILANGIPLCQAIKDAEAAVAYVLGGAGDKEPKQLTRTERKNRILDMWADGDSTQQIADAVGVKRNSVLVVVTTARNSGDHRAMRRKHLSEAHLTVLRGRAAEMGRARRKSVRQEAAS